MQKVNKDVQKPVYLYEIDLLPVILNYNASIVANYKRVAYTLIQL